jgi:hypothetical protein
MKTIPTLSLPLDTCKEVVLSIINQLPEQEFCTVTEEIQLLARKRSFSILEQIHLSAKRGRLSRNDFAEASGTVCGFVFL